MQPPQLSNDQQQQSTIDHSAQQQSTTIPPPRTAIQLLNDITKDPMTLLPYPRTIAELQQVQFHTPFQETCAFKTVQGCVIGGGAGAAFTLLMSVINVGMGSSAMMQPGMPGYVEPGSSQLSLKQMRSDFRVWRRTTGQSMRTSAKGFALFSGCYAATDCALERYRGQHDWMNAIAAGGAAGGACALRSGPTAMALGLVGGAAFTYAIESFMGNH